MKKENSKIYLVEQLEVYGDGSCDSIAGYCSTKTEAEAIAIELEKENKEEIERYNNYCRECICNCESFSNKNIEKGKKELEKLKKKNCPFAKNLRLSEVIFGNGKKKKSGGYEIFCDNMVHYPDEWIYHVVECDRLMKNGNN